MQYNHYLSGGGTFDEDHFQKNTTIKISKLGSTYTVECIVEYTDYTNVSVIRSAYVNSGNNVYKPTTTYGDGVVYKKEFADSIPPIYLLYVPAIYNGAYCTTDNITVDKSGVSEDAKIYVFESTAELSDTYKKIICEQFGEILHIQMQRKIQRCRMLKLEQSLHLEQMQIVWTCLQTLILTTIILIIT